MVSAAPRQARWVRDAPRRDLPAAVLKRIADAAFGGRRVLSAEPLDDSLRNSNFRLHLEQPAEKFVLRIYEHDPSLCRKEIDVMRMVADTVPVPEVVYFEPAGWDDLPPFALLRWIEGITFRDLKRGGDVEATAQAASAVGETLAAIGRYTFPRSGWIGPGPAVTAPLREGADPMPRFVDVCLESDILRNRMPEELRARTHSLMWSVAPRLAALDDTPCLVHGDFNRRNVLMRQNAGRWRVAAVLDWEFAVAGTSLADLGNFLCYERAARPLAEPHFSAGYAAAGGKLADDWRRLARIVNLAGICASLSRDKLPPQFIPELVELVRATIEDRDPEI